MRLNTFPLFLTGRFLYRVHIKVRQGHHIITYWFVVYNFETLKWNRMSWAMIRLINTWIQKKINQVWMQAVFLNIVWLKSQQTMNELNHMFNTSRVLYFSAFYATNCTALRFNNYVWSGFQPQRNSSWCKLQETKPAWTKLAWPISLCKICLFHDWTHATPPTHQIVSFPGPLQPQISPLALQGLQAGYLGPHLQGLLWR